VRRAAFANGGTSVFDPVTGLARPGDVTRRHRLGGLIHEYSLAPRPLIDPRDPPLGSAAPPYREHYNVHRPHRSLALHPPNEIRPFAPTRHSANVAVCRRDLLGGLIHEYQLAA